LVQQHFLGKEKAGARSSLSVEVLPAVLITTELVLLSLAMVLIVRVRR